MISLNHLRKRFHFHCSIYPHSTTTSFSTLAVSFPAPHEHEIRPNPGLKFTGEFPGQATFSLPDAATWKVNTSLFSHLGGSNLLEDKSTCFSPYFPEKRDAIIARYSSDFDTRRLHLEIIRNGFVKDLFMCNTLINSMVGAGDMVSAFKVFDEMPDRNLVTWACMISGYTKNKMFYDAFRVFQTMMVSGVSLSHYALGSALRACQGLGSEGLRFGMQIHGLVLKTPYCSHVLVSNVLISMYGGCMSSAEYAWNVFEGLESRNSISWNSLISVCSQREDVDSSFELFSRMRKEGAVSGFAPSEYTFGSLVTAASCNGIFLLEQMLATVEKSGCLQDLYVGSAFVSGFSKLGMLNIAKKIFEQMTTRNAATLNGLMIGLVRLNQGEQAAMIFKKMGGSVRLNSDSLLVLLTAFPEFSCLEAGCKKGRQVHAQLIGTGLFHSKITIGNGLINMYAKCGSINYAASVFKGMTSKDSVSWNSMITGLDQNECFEDALYTFHTMTSTGIVPSNFTLISALSSCGSLGWIKLGEQIHCEGLKLGLDLDVSVSNALLSLYANSGFTDTCRKLFFLMPQYDQVSWNSIIGALNGSDTYGHETILYFKEMMRYGWGPNKVTFINILEALPSLSLLEVAHQTHSIVVKHGAMNNLSIENALICCYGKCGEIGYCETIFSRMQGRKDDVSWNCMISSYIHNELLSEAMNLVWHMLQSGQRLDSFTLASVLSACASIATLERGMEVHACAIKSFLESDVVIGTSLVDMYTKCGRIDYGYQLFDLMPTRNRYTWNSMICGYARHGEGRKALDLFERMEQHGQSPDHVTFVGLLSACSHVGLVDQGFHHFESMSKVYGLNPRMEHYSCMVDLLGRAGKIDKIEDFINGMLIEPNALIWRTVLGVCSRTNNFKSQIGQRAAKMLLEMEPQNAVNYVLVSNMHASKGMWEDMAEARDVMKESSVRKEAGCSWVTMKDGVHVFVSGDKAHPDKEAIYEKHKELHIKLKDAGYVPESKYSMYDIEQENREELLSYHSERLAVAFILTRKSELPIRIMKNLRICTDCHSAFKYLSEIIGRQITIRDSNRFHHFHGGKCSCNDYW